MPLSQQEHDELELLQLQEEEAKSQPQQQPPPREATPPEVAAQNPQSPATSMLREAASGATGGQSERIASNFARAGELGKTHPLAAYLMKAIQFVPALSGAVNPILEKNQNLQGAAQSMSAPQEQYRQEHPINSAISNVAGGLVGAPGAMAGQVAKTSGGALMSLLQGAGKGAATAGLGTAAQNDELKSAGYNPDKLPSPGIAAAVGGLAGGATGAIQGAGRTGGKLADELQQSAMGMSKFKPGAGTAAIEEGVAGSREQMLPQVENALSTHGKNMEALASQLEGDIKPDPLVKYFNEKATQNQLPPELLPSETNNIPNMALARSMRAEARGNISPEEAFNLSKQLKAPAYNPRTGMPVSGPEKGLQRSEAKLLMDQVKQLSEEQQGGQFGQSADKYGNLAAALKGLQKGESPQVPSSMGGLVRKAYGGPRMEAFAARQLNKASNAAQAVPGNAKGSAALAQLLAEIQANQEKK